MRKVVSMLLAAALLLGLLSACQKPAPAASASLGWSVSDLAELAFEHSGREAMDGLEGINAEMDREWIEAYLENAYEIQLPWEDAAVIRATGSSAFEIAVLRMEDSDSAVQAAAALMSYVFARQGDFAGYAPAEADMVAKGSILQNGPFAALFICPDPDGAFQIAEAALSGEYDPDQPGPSQEVADDVKELRDLLVSVQGIEYVNLEKLDDSNLDALNTYMKDAYGLDVNQWEECAIARGTGDSVFEVAVIRAPEDWDVIVDVEGLLNDYLSRREAEFDSSSEQARLLHGAVVGAGSPYVVLLACEDRTGAINAFCKVSGAAGFGYSLRYRYMDTDPDPEYPDRCKFTPPNKDDMSLYDTSDILAAWESGNPAGLFRDDRKIFDQAQKVLKKVLKSGMSDYEKEVAVYHWVVNNVNYDWTHQDRMKTTPRESFTPYGGLVNRKAVCLGYATTFQLLMDLAGVECITVLGAAFESQEDHGWNMVRINGEWYCVDVTWDSNYREQGGRGRQVDWDYFNVTSGYMAESNHQWNYSNTPEATAEDQGRS